MVAASMTSISSTSILSQSLSLDVIDGATIKPLIGEDGRAPEASDPGERGRAGSCNAAGAAQRELAGRRIPASHCPSGNWEFPR